MASTSEVNPEPGPGVDSQGRPVIDPTRNVLDLVSAAIKRQDDLREMESKHSRELADLRAGYDRELRAAETNRIDAIRAVDVGAVNRAAEVQAQQATVLAAQLAATAEASRTQVATAAAAAVQNLNTALEPLQKAIADLRQSQYELQGARTQTTETKSSQRLDVNTILVAGSLALAAIIGILNLVVK